ncbi:hypothetical protein P12x_005130 [Tundrisphaera lichenicola]|uniref:hypothetical protein n=1 Tax=Tundrisphaera lichenicola TaxID=2029860 RepID=UPI003EBEA522
MSRVSMMSGPGNEHPDVEVLARFIQGRLDAAAMASVELHLGGCEVCCRTLLTAPDDRLTRLLKSRNPEGIEV